MEGWPCPSLDMRRASAPSGFRGAHVVGFWASLLNCLLGTSWRPADRGLPLARRPLGRPAGPGHHAQGDRSPGDGVPAPLRAAARLGPGPEPRLPPERGGPPDLRRARPCPARRRGPR
eukprot:4188430-Alexandrium_andersonii.AAC.1